MKKGTVRQNFSYCQKWIVNLTVLILILSLISLSAAGHGNNTDNNESAEMNPGSKIAADRDDYTVESTGEYPETEENIGNGTDNLESPENYLEEAAGTPEEDSQRNPEENLETGTETGESVYNPLSAGKNPKIEIETEENTGSKELIKTSPETKTEIEQPSDSQKIPGESQEIKKVESNSPEIREGSDEGSGVETGAKPLTDNHDSIGKNPDTVKEAEKSAEHQDSTEKNPEAQIRANDDTSSQKNIKTNPDTGMDAEKSSGDQASVRESQETQTGANSGKDSEYAKENPEIDTATEKSTDNQEQPEKKHEILKVEDRSPDNPEDTCTNPVQKDETKEDSESLENQGVNPKRETTSSSEKYDSGRPGKNIEMKTGLCEGSKNPKADGAKIEPGVEGCIGLKSLRSGESESGTAIKACNGQKKPETAIKACNGQRKPENENLESRIKIGGINWTYVPETLELKPEIKPELWSSFPSERLWTEGLKSGINPEKNGWKNLRFILAYPSSPRWFYTTRESVKINYNGSEALRGQKVDVYLVKTNSPGISEDTAKNVTDSSTIRFEDILNKNTEFYVQVPATLNRGGDLSSLTLGPLPEGSYWVAVTLTGNKIKIPEPEKKILQANYFEVLEYEMDTDAPHTLEEGHNFEVNLSLRNAPARENETYWAVLIKEEACGTGKNTDSGSSSTKTAAWTLANGLGLIRDFRLNPADPGSETGKEELESKFQALVGEGNGTISMGEENQSTLSIKSCGLAPGKYLLFTGEYERDGSLAGMAQEELTISPARKEDTHT